MKKEKEGAVSLKWALFTTVFLCWVMPIVTIITVVGIMLGVNYDKQISSTVKAKTNHAMEQVELRFSSAIDASKAASYDGQIWNYYRSYMANGNEIRLYSDVTAYLAHEYARDANFQAVFLTFLSNPDQDYAYVVSKGANSYQLLNDYQQNVRGKVADIASKMDTGIDFEEIDGQLYMIRNLMDKNFTPYAILTMQCDRESLFQSLQAISSFTDAEIQLDDLTIPLTDEESQMGSGRKTIVTEQSIEVEGHTLTYRSIAAKKTLWNSMPGFRWAVTLLLLLVIPLLLLIVYIFYQHVSHPVEALVNASTHVQAGERGYTITDIPRNKEFRKLVQHFNAMSQELKTQFDSLYLEQQALQESRIKALQSQINPHFLGNTLEIINWEARLAENDKVSAMIEALSTMMDGAIGRDGRAQIPLRQELSYVDAYLYIIKQRIGDRLSVIKEIDESLLDTPIPRLLLQTLAENAVEHDISKGRGSEIIMRIYKDEEKLNIEVEHEGSISPEDKKNIEAFLSTPVGAAAPAGHVGIRNLNQRLQLIYGDRSILSVSEVTPGHVLARAILPFMPSIVNNGEVSK